MLDEFNEIARDLWEQSKPPLEEMYDRWMGQGNWEPRPPKTRFAIYSHRDVVWCGRRILAGQPFPCHICGETDRWCVEGDEVRRLARVFVCEHEPVQLGFGALRKISTVPVHLVGRYEETFRFSG